jgi:hypothetical protein
MSRFSDVVYNAGSHTADIGAGLIWDDVYAALDPHGVNVVGGGVSGLALLDSLWEEVRVVICRRLDTNYMSQVIHGKRINMVWHRHGDN